MLADKDLRVCRNAETATVVSNMDSGSNLIAAARKGRRQNRRCHVGAVKPSGAGGTLRELQNLQQKAVRRGQQGQKQWQCWEGTAARLTKALIMGYASLWFALLEGRKLFELRRHAIDIPRGGLRLLLICSKSMRRRFGLTCCMAEGICCKKIGPLTADCIIKSPYLRGGVLASDEEIRRLLPSCAGRHVKGYLYQIVGVRMSKATWEEWLGNGSNCQNFFDKLCGDQPRWTEK